MKFLSSLVLVFALSCNAFAQEAAKPDLTVELNTMADANGGCQLTFVAKTGFSKGINQIILETVLFDKAGTVNRLTLFDFGAIPADRPRVRQFIVPELTCGNLSQILINGINTCEVPGKNADACASGMSVTSRTDVELIG